MPAPGVWAMGSDRATADGTGFNVVGGGVNLGWRAGDPREFLGYALAVFRWRCSGTAAYCLLFLAVRRRGLSRGGRRSRRHRPVGLRSHVGNLELVAAVYGSKAAGCGAEFARRWTRTSADDADHGVVGLPVGRGNRLLSALAHWRQRRPHSPLHGMLAGRDIARNPPDAPPGAAVALASGHCGGDRRRSVFNGLQRRHHPGPFLRPRVRRACHGSLAQEAIGDR